MIIQIVGTNASGKTTAMRKVIEATSVVIPIKNEKNKVIAYNCDNKFRVLGPYEGTPSSGMDAIGGTAEGAVAFIKEHHDAAGTVLFEGMRMHNLKRHTAFVNAGIDYHIFLLTTTLEEALEGLRERRAAKGQEMLEDTSNIEANMRRSRSYASNMYQVGAKLHKVSRNDCPAAILEVLNNA